MNKLIKSIKRIEKIAYKDVSYMRQLKYAYSINDIKEYMETEKIEIYSNSYSYMLIGITGDEMEIGDIATIKGLSLADVSSMLSFINKVIVKYNLSYITCDMREKTSYRLLPYICRKLPAKILLDSEYNWGSEVMHEIRLQVLN